MRESEIRVMLAQNAKRSSLLLDQFQFLETRQRAMESVLYGLPLLERVKAFFSPSRLKQIVDAMHMQILSEEKAKLTAAVEKAKEESRKPKITIVSPTGNAVLNGNGHG